MTNLIPTKVTLSQDVLYQEIEKEAVMLNLTNEQYYGLNDVGRHMWQLLSEHDSIGRVLAELDRYYDADMNTLEGDLMTLIDQLQAAGLASAENNAT